MTSGSREPDVLFLNMPVVGIERPSIALGILQARLRAAGIPSRALHANVFWAARVGLENQRVVEHRHIFMLGEWLFAGKAFGGFEGLDADWYLSRLAEPRAGFCPIDEEDLRLRLHWLRRESEAFVDEIAERVVDLSPRVVGCTSVFQQHVASLAVLRRIREIAPEIVTLMGGSNCETIMGRTTHDCFEWVDYVVSGEADELIAPLMHGLIEHGRDLEAATVPYGVFAPVHRFVGYPVGDKTYDGVPRAVVERLGDAPAPEYDDYFSDLEASGVSDRVTPGLPFESARGCWWGQKHLCSFCGLNGGAIGFRTKPWESVEAELDYLSSRHGVTRFEAVDNILSLDFFKTLLPALEQRGAPYRIFFETKANLKRDQVRALRDAGVTMIQPGIESLCTKVLELMSKGVSAPLNLQLLKWCHEYGIRTNWNLMYDFPGEEDDWYVEMSEWLPLVWHLQPPVNLVKTQFHRYSAYHETPEAYGLDLTAAAEFFEVYPLDEPRLSDLVYYFVDRNAQAPVYFLDVRLDRPGVARIADQVVRWNASYWGEEERTLTMVVTDDAIEIDDTREVAVAGRARLEGLAREIYLACDDAVRIEALLTRIERGGQASRSEAEEVIGDLLARKLMLKIDASLLSLAIRAPVRPFTRELPFGKVDWPEPTPMQRPAHAGST